jgi:hypothetical protein
MLTDAIPEVFPPIDKREQFEGIAGQLVHAGLELPARPHFTVYNQGQRWGKKPHEMSGDDIARYISIRFGPEYAARLRSRFNLTTH